MGSNICIQSGAGGNDAADWTVMLFRMYEVRGISGLRLILQMPYSIIISKFTCIFYYFL